MLYNILGKKFNTHQKNFQADKLQWISNMIFFGEKMFSADSV